jgi:hypothetical protein
MKKIGIVLIVFLLFCIGESQIVIDQSTFETQGTAVDFDTLIGPLPSIVKHKKIPYLITSNIEVPLDRTVTIEPGTVFLFKNFTGLHIRGKLLARGTENAPIVFTSEFDKNYNGQAKREANPFDWDGIYMTSDAMGSQFTNCTIAFSVYCISSSTKYLRLDPLVVKDNGKNIITIEDVEYPLTDSTFSYSIDKTDAFKDGIPIELFRDPVAKKRNTFRILGTVLFAGGLVSSIYYATEMNKANTQLEQISGSDFDNLNKNSSSAWKKAEDKTLTNKLLLSSGVFVTLVGIASFSWTFTF